jgi:hypothetical protein
LGQKNLDFIHCHFKISSFHPETIMDVQSISIEY